MNLIVDNHDSFTHLLGDSIESVARDVVILRNDDPRTLSWVRDRPLRSLVVSPGPKDPARTPQTTSIIASALGKMPILGVCLGHQALAVVLGGSIQRLPNPIHGMASRLMHSGVDLFEGVPAETVVGRYHSLAVVPGSLPPHAKTLATTEDGVIMAFGCPALCAYGVQFHPESFLSSDGRSVLANFYRMADSWLMSRSATN